MAHRHREIGLAWRGGRRGGGERTPRRSGDPEVAGILWVVAFVLLLTLVLAVLP